MLTPPNTTAVRSFEILAVVTRALRHLRGELARRREHQRARRAAAAARRSLCRIGSTKAGGFAGARLGAGEHVAAREVRREWPGTEWEWACIAFFGYGTQQLGLEPEIGNDIMKTSL